MQNRSRKKIVDVWNGELSPKKITAANIGLCKSRAEAIAIQH